MRSSLDGATHSQTSILSDFVNSGRTPRKSLGARTSPETGPQRKFDAGLHAIRLDRRTRRIASPPKTRAKRTGSVSRTSAGSPICRRPSKAAEESGTPEGCFRCASTPLGTSRDNSKISEYFFGIRPAPDESSSRRQGAGAASQEIVTVVLVGAAEVKSTFGRKSYESSCFRACCKSLGPSCRHENRVLATVFRDSGKVGFHFRPIQFP